MRLAVERVGRHIHSGKLLDVGHELLHNTNEKVEDKGIGNKGIPYFSRIRLTVQTSNEWQRRGGDVVPVVTMLAKDGGCCVDMLVVVVVVSACIFASGSRFTPGMLANADVKVDVFEMRMRMDEHQ